MFDKRLIKSINRGRCFAFVGSGPSCEIDYPSWGTLASQTYDELTRQGRISDDASYKKYLREKKFPEFFKIAESDFGGRDALIEVLKKVMSIRVTKRGVIYSSITKWPFACYLTTNFDDEIQKYLKDLNVYYTVVQNKREDFFSFRDGVSNIIQKLHADFDHPEDAIITSSDYKRFYVEDAGQYFRENLCRIFGMFDILILGHSLSDPDINYILQCAKKTADCTHPIYMMAADFTKAEEQEYFEKYNVVLLHYANPDGSHSELKRILRAVDRFIVPRSRMARRHVPVTPVPEESSQAAITLYMYNRLQGARSANYLSPLVLSVVASASPKVATAASILDAPLFRKLAVTPSALERDVEDTLVSLLAEKLISNQADGYVATLRGKDVLAEYKAIRDREREQAYGQFIIEVRQNIEKLQESQAKACEHLAEEVLMDCFSSRGLAISNKVFSGRTVNADELTDIFGYVSNKASELAEMDLRAAFVDAMYTFLVEPTVPQKNYLASLSQGYFFYHMLGLDPAFHATTTSIFEKTLWLCDSSVVLPLLAVGCHNHDYAVDLFKTLSDSHAKLCTTPKLLQEAWEHFDWAKRFMEMTRYDSPEFMRAALVKGTYKQNLFVDGYIRLSAEGAVGSFADYLNQLFPDVRVDRTAFERKVAEFGLLIVNIGDVAGFVSEDWGEIDAAKRGIQAKREKQGTYRSELQVDAESEILIFLQHLRDGKYSLPGSVKNLESFYFVSQSRILDQVCESDALTTWSPEALYRYVSALPGRNADPDLLQQCMLHEYFYAGISFIDKEYYLRFFGPSIDSARVEFEKEKASYISDVESSYVQDLDAEFERIPDLEKPFFVMQMAWKTAAIASQRAEIALARAKAAEAKAKQLEREKQEHWKNKSKDQLRQEEARLRHLQDPKYLKKKMKQAKQRKKTR